MDPKNVTRSFAKTAHADGLDRANYHIVTSSKVTKVLFDGNAADGVVFHAKGGNPNKTRTVKARKEVILATGTMHTPQILQVSGIGPKKLLESAKIPVKVALEGVGANLQDHPDVSMTVQCKHLC
jgi:choline dehydrogenase